MFPHAIFTREPGPERSVIVLSLLGALIGFGGSVVPQVLKMFQDKSDKAHEIKLLEMQLQSQSAGHTQRLEEINVVGDMEESKALYQSAEIKFSGVSWIDAIMTALTGSVRPMLTYSFFGLYSWVKISLYNVDNNILTVWTPEDMGIFCTIIGFWFGNRSMQKFFKR